MRQMADALRAATGQRPGFCRKDKHASKGAAEAQIRSLVKRGLNRNITLAAYKCPRCFGWHVGHSRRR